MEIFDISMTIFDEMSVYKNKAEKRPVFAFSRKIPPDSINESVLTMNVHTGTHIDAPYHVDGDGATTDALDLHQLVRQCKVLDLTHISGGLGEECFTGKAIEKNDFLILKTKNSFVEEFREDFVFLDRSGAAYLAQIGIAGVGIDALGIERGQPGHETHKILFSSGIIIIEGLRLGEVAEGIYMMCALPLKLKGVDGSPARVILIKEQGEKSAESL